MLARGDGEIEGARLFTPGAGNHGGLARSLGDRPHLYPQRWDRVAKRVIDENADITVLSSELFEFIAPRAVLQAIEAHLPGLADTLRVVVYVRPHTARVLSQFAENVKLGHSMGSLDDFVSKFIKAGRLGFSKRIAKWQAVFGNRLVVRPFVRNRLEHEDVRHDFMTVVANGARYHLRETEPDDNASLNIEDLALMRYLQNFFEVLSDVNPDHRVAFGKQLGRLLRDNPAPAAGQKLRLSETLYARLAETCAEDAADMDAKWFGEPCFVTALERANEGLVSEVQSLEAEDYFDAQTLRHARVLAALSLKQMSGFSDTYAQVMNRL
ncbi:MAG: hypothetical protein AB3N11_00750 [Arenibacterium sp.]